MAIECHQGAKPEDTFHTIQGLLDCGLCNGIIANIPAHQGADDAGELILVCPSCGSEHYPEDLADARVEEILERVNKEPTKYEERIRQLRATLEKALQGLDSAERYFDREDNPGTVRAVHKALRAVRRELNKPALPEGV